MNENLSRILDDLGIVYKQVGRKKGSSFESIRQLEAADENSLVFVNKPNETTIEILIDGCYSVILIEQQWGIEHLDRIENINASIFLVENPRLAITQVMRILYPEEQCFRGIHPTAQIHPGAIIASTASVGAFSIIEDRVKIGDNVIIREFCFIGGSGCGFVRSPDGVALRIPHIGTVVIEDDVEIFPYVNIDRGTLGETRVKKGAKIDHYVYISHNSVIGEDCIITGGTAFCGGSKIGKRSWVGVGSIIKEKVCVGDDVIIGLGSVVIGDVENGVTVAGVPAKILRKIK